MNCSATKNPLYHSIMLWPSTISSNHKNARNNGSGLIWIALAVMAGLELVLFLAVQHILTGPWETFGHFIRVNFTPLIWSAYLPFLLGVLSYRDRLDWLRTYRFRLAVLWLWSVPAWCFFDWINFYFMVDSATGLHAWNYQGIPANPVDRFAGYLLAFAAIAPGMLLTAEVWMRLGLKHWNSQKGIRITRVIQITCLLLGMLFFCGPFVERSPIADLMLWVSLIFLLDPINFWCGRPSIIGDWIAGRWGRTLALMFGGLTCGFLWEFWNYWALAKWTYHLPFLGWWQHIRYFQMPVPGLLGFLSFGVEIWVMWQFSLLALHWFVEGETDTDEQKHYRCI
jgi:hypothetical protein